MHISEQEKYRLEKEHRMRNGYQLHDGKKDEVNEHAYVHKDTENKHARESQPDDYSKPMGAIG